MKSAKTLFVVLDIETTENSTKKPRLAFDVAWKIIDRNGEEYGAGSYLISEVLKMALPYYKKKWPQYIIDHENGLIEYATIDHVVDTLNDQMNTLRQKGHRVIICAYNARFDLTWLPFTYHHVTGDLSTDKFDQWTDLLDIWDYWGQSVPKCYTAEKTKSGKFLSTSAESAYRYETFQPHFEEMHIAHHDVEIEVDILLKALKRKKKMPIAQSKEQMPGAVWKQINERVNPAIVAQMSMFL
jgi:hypothetical protein